MSDYLLLLFVVMIVVASLVTVCFYILAKPRRQYEIRTDFDGYKGKEMNERLVSRGR
jgi:hypothetical protein